MERSNFIRLCRSCHSKYDFTEETRRKLVVYYKNKDKNQPHPLTGRYTLPPLTCAYCGKVGRRHSVRRKLCSNECRIKHHKKLMQQKAIEGKYPTHREFAYGAHARKLTKEDVEEIRRLCKEKTMKQVDIAKKFNVAPHNISQIKLNKIWKIK